MPKKKSSKSEKSVSSSPSVDAASNERNSRMVLRAKSSEKMKRLALLSRESEDKWMPKSVKGVKATRGKKSVKLDAKVPKKPPTAFFYLL